DLLRKAIPVLPQAYAIANQHLVHTLRGIRSAALLDIGIGKGAQVVTILRTLGAEPGALRRLRIVALDPSASNLAEAKSAIEAAVSQMPGLPFTVEIAQLRGLIERWEPAALQHTIGAVDGVAINAAYALHHTTHPPNDQQARTDLLRRLAGLRPRVFTLVEPNANHDTELLTKRVHSCWQHFGAVFDLVDRSDASPREKLAIKDKFFGREVRDILGTSDTFRCERHEPYESWLLRLTKAGLKPHPPIKLDITLPDYCWATEREGLVRLGYRDQALIAAFAYCSPEAS
ncbi:MAG TPA: GRAS family protein, partial [Nannocystis sp.]